MSTQSPVTQSRPAQSPATQALPSQSPARQALAAGPLPSASPRSRRLEPQWIPAASRAATPSLRATPSLPERSLASIPDDELLRRLAEILGDARRVEADLIAHIAEVDQRRLFLGEACSSMFGYCVERLHLSEPETALRIVVARASRRHPVLLEMLRDGRLHLSGIALLAPHLTEQNRDEVLAQASHLSKRQVEELVARLAPRPDVPTLIRSLPPQRHEATHFQQAAQGEHRPDDAGHQAEHRPAEAASAPSDDAARFGDTAPTDCGQTALGPSPPGPPASRQCRRGSLQPLSASRYRVQFTASAQLQQKLERLQVLMRASVPDGDLAALIEDAVTEKIARLEARRLGAASEPRRSVAQSDTRPGPRYIPAAVKRAVRLRDGDRCAYVDGDGRRCTERGRLQFHHRHPHGFGGDRSPANIALLCRAHNRFEAAADFGAVRKPT